MEAIYTGNPSSEGLWMEIENHSGCYLWNPNPGDDETVRWSGECSEGFAEGRGEVTWSSNAIEAGLFQGGQREGFHVISRPTGRRDEGPYVDGEQHGVWTYFDENGRELGTITYEHGRRAGG